MRVISTGFKLRCYVCEGLSPKLHMDRDSHLDRDIVTWTETLSLGQRQSLGQRHCHMDRHIVTWTETLSLGHCLLSTNILTLIC